MIGLIRSVICHPGEIRSGEMLVEARLKELPSGAMGRSLDKVLEIPQDNGDLKFADLGMHMTPVRHCEKRSDEAVSSTRRLLHFVRNDSLASGAYPGLPMEDVW